MLMSKDMELSCDERVLKEMDEDLKKPYANLLLTLATEKHILNGNPFAFGEGNLEGRINNVLNYKRPKFWVIVFSIVIVTTVAIGLMANPKAVVIIGGADEPTDIIISHKNKIVIAEADGVALYANDVTDGIYEGMIVQTEDEIKAFPWVNVTNPTYVPIINVTDVDNDGKDEVIIILTTGYGTSVLQQKIHILNMDGLSEINIQDPIQTISKEVTSTIAKDEGKIKVTIKWNENVIEKNYNESDAGIWFDEVSFGSIIMYEIIDNKITASIIGSVSPSVFPVTAFIEYGSDLQVNTFTILEQN